MKILITGDIATWNIKDFSTEKINKEIINKIKIVDYFICNLEGPIRQSNKNYNLQIRTNSFKDFVLKTIMKATKKEQPIVYSDKSIIDLLTLNKNTLVTLANNHIKDCGIKGFKDTLRVLEDNSINFVGAGYNLEEANRYFELNENIVIINVNLVAAKKYNIPFFIYNSTVRDYGAAYLSFSDLRDEVRRIKRLNKKTILIIHGGNELPESVKDLGINLNKIRKIGANITVIHQPHIYVETEFEKDSIFVIGDFIFCRPGYLDSKRQSAFLQIEYTDNNLIPYLFKFNINDIILLSANHH